MYPSFQQLQVHSVSLSFDTWLDLLKKPLPERPGFSMESGVIQVGQVLAKFMGIPLDVDEYYNRLFDYVHSEELNLTLLSADTLDKTIENHRFQSIQKVINIYYDQQLSINRFVAFLDGEELLLKSANPVLQRKIREAMKITLELFASRETEGLRNPSLRRVLVDLVKWSFNHLEQPLSKADPQMQMPRFLWYGDFKTSHQYFLFFLVKLGCDCIMVHPEGKDILADMLTEPVFTHHFQNKEPAEPFPTERRARTTTVAYRASKEMETVLHHEGSGLYKPWQLRDYLPSSLTLKTTYDELFILSKAIALVRPNFAVENGKVRIPCLFAKIHGISKNKKEYWDRLQQLTEFDNSLLIRHFPFTIVDSNDFRFHYRNALGKDGLLSIEKMMKAHYWSYRRLPAGLQKGIGYAIRQMCKNPRMKREENESLEELRIYLFRQAMKIPKSIMQLLERFDYSQSIPKVILYNNELHGVMQRSDAALLLLLNQFGVDILIYNPAGHNDIENYLDPNAYDTHWLDEVAFEQEFKEPSVLKKVFLYGILKNFKGD